MRQTRDEAKEKEGGWGGSALSPRSASGSVTIFGQAAANIWETRQSLILITTLQVEEGEPSADCLRIRNALWEERRPAGTSDI